MTTNRLLANLTSPDPEVARLVESTDEQTERILEAAFEQVAASGFRRTTIEDVARRAGLGRATVYRRFPNKAMLTDALMLRELRRYLEGANQASASAQDPESSMADSGGYTVAFLRDHPLLKRLLETEPEVVLRALTVDAAPLIAAFREYCVANWITVLHGGGPVSDEVTQHLATVAELHVRVGLSFILTPETAIPLGTPERAKAFTEHYLAPMLNRRG